MNAQTSIDLFNSDVITFNATTDSNIISVAVSSLEKNVIYNGMISRTQVVELINRINDLLVMTNGQLKIGDIIVIGHKRASGGILDDYSDKVGLKATVVDPDALWSIDEEGNEVRFVYAALEGKKRNKYVGIHIEDAVRVMV
ncbi:hypothetical protein [Paenibacillus sp. URB8-2]|uniref:hypothetical protein n=1 Tax=Paenibacillus sp. URB8-2 TaxID=2741301 RepID=UPI0015BB5BFA|nr:hypothetical protein [Paenibacillus sp. URB8-2]BCG56769.1 hypothetical protein PUR_01940 [Paenibacillus sp. URB8-2]